MTVRHFDGVDDVIVAEPLSPNFTGDGTLAVLWRASDSGNHGLVCGDASGFERYGLLPVAGDEVYYDCSGFTPVHAWSPDEWYLTIVTKPSGLSTVRQHSVAYSTGTWAHVDRSAINEDVGGGHTATEFGHTIGNDFYLEGELAVVGIWTGVVLTDSECEDLEFELSNWLTVPPSALWAFNQDDVGDPVLDLSGNGHDQTAITGTSVITGDDPPGFNFSLTEDTTFYRDGGVWVPTTRFVRQAGAWVAV